MVRVRNYSVENITQKLKRCNNSEIKKPEIKKILSKNNKVKLLNFYKLNFLLDLTLPIFINFKIINFLIAFRKVNYKLSKFKTF